jgi:hypothetical protein
MCWDKSLTPFGNLGKEKTKQTILGVFYLLLSQLIFLFFHAYVF